jgi:hypothetical protein
MTAPLLATALVAFVVISLAAKALLVRPPPARYGGQHKDT